MKSIYEIENTINMNKLQSLKDFDFVEYCGCESWKPNRRIVDNEGKRKWYWDKPEENEDFNPELDSYEQMTDVEHLQESAWMFCDTIAQDTAERNVHYFDYALTGERMGWKAGDEYWLVFNCAMKRFELRKADPNKWTPLERYFITKKLELKFKWMYLYYSSFHNFMIDKFKLKYIQNISFNSFPDRIEIRPADYLCTFEKNDKDKDVNFIYPQCVFDAYEQFSSIKDTFKDLVIPKGKPFLFDEEHKLYSYFRIKMEDKTLMKQLKIMEENGRLNTHKVYNICDESVEDPKEYMKIFYKYNHTYQYRLKHPNKE